MVKQFWCWLTGHRPLRPGEMPTPRSGRPIVAMRQLCAKCGRMVAHTKAGKPYGHRCVSRDEGRV